MKRLIKNSQYINCMSNLRGREAKILGPLSFSFYFGSKYQEQDTELVHGIRVKLVNDPEKIIKKNFSILEIHGDYKFHPDTSDNRMSSKLVNQARKFFKQNKVLFSAVWEEELDENDLRAYLKGEIGFTELLKLFDFYDKFRLDMKNINNLEDLEKFIRSNNIFNMND